MKKRLLTFLTAIALIAGCIAVPTVEAQAATVNVYSAVSPDPSYQVFYISTDDWAHTRYDLFDGTTWTYDQRLNSSSGELHLDPRVDYDIYVYQGQMTAGITWKEQKYQPEVCWLMIIQ